MLLVRQTRLESLVVIVHGNREDLLGSPLTYHISLKMLVHLWKEFHASLKVVG